jgi:thymidylate synthase
MKYYINADHAFRSLLSRLGTGAEPGNGTREIIGEQHCFINSRDIILSANERKFKIDYALQEVIWYLSRNRSIKEIGESAKIWKMIADSRQEVESNYGTYIWNDHPEFQESQFDWIIKELTADLTSRKAVLNINSHSHKYKNQKDLPCTISISFLVRDNALNMFVNMRSNDLIFGWCNDIFAFSFIQQLVYNELKQIYPNLGLGEYYHSATSLHVYEKHYHYFDVGLTFPVSRYILDLPEFLTFSYLNKILNFNESLEKNVEILKPLVIKEKKDLL